jgi:nitrite reductase/ring-hydroxylating ferredoxin subunit
MSHGGAANGFVRVASLGEVPADRGLAVTIGGREIALFRVGTKVHAIDNSCLHEGGSLADGELQGKVVACPWHGWRFDVSTGVCTFHDGLRMACHAVRVDGDDVLVQLAS